MGERKVKEIFLRERKANRITEKDYSHSKLEENDKAKIKKLQDICEKYMEIEREREKAEIDREAEEARRRRKATEATKSETDAEPSEDKKEIEIEEKNEEKIESQNPKDIEDEIAK